MRHRVCVYSPPKKRGRKPGVPNKKGKTCSSALDNFTQVRYDVVAVAHPEKHSKTELATLSHDLLRSQHEQRKRTAMDSTVPLIPSSQKKRKFDIMDLICTAEQELRKETNKPAASFRMCTSSELPKLPSAATLELFV